MSPIDPKLRQLAVATIRTLAIDGVERAKSGHPGTPMALADVALAIFMRHLRYDPTAPSWPDRDRFVLSCGHASMLLYALLHLAGYDLSIEELERFRQWGSKTPGHPELGMTPGVETTTGPLGQGLGNAIGMAAALKMLRARAKRDDLTAARVFVLASDGDLMEGLGCEAASLGGHLGLDNLVVVWDDNRITIDGATSLAFSEDVQKRFEASGWATFVIDGHDPAAIDAALDAAVALEGKPTLICARTIIGIGSPKKQGTHKAHGEPLGPDEARAVKESLGWPTDEPFRVPDEVRALFAERALAGQREREAWERGLDALRSTGTTEAQFFERLLDKHLPEGLFEALCDAAPDKPVATRVAAGVIEQRLAALVPSLAGGSADLNPSTKTFIEGSPALERGRFEGRNVHFGVREHVMGAFINGMAMTEGFIPFGSTFLVFSDYMRPSIRLAALSHLGSIFVFTHDSIHLGEDGPTHQPIEHLWALRLIPNVDVFRPADPLECAAAWAHAVERRTGPTVMCLSRQNLPVLSRPAGFDRAHLRRGAYVLCDAADPTLVLIATGSEVALAAEVKPLLEADGERVRVVSAPCWEQFEREPEAYRREVLPEGVSRVFIELGVTAPWRGVVGPGGLVLGLDRFGASAPSEVLAKEFGFVPEAVRERIRAFRKASS